MHADLCCSRAPQAVLQGAPLDRSSKTHCSAAWSMASAGYLPPLSDRQNRPRIEPPDKGHPKQTQTRQTNSGRNLPRRRAKQKKRGKNRGPRGRQKIPVLSHLSERCCFLATQTTSTNKEGTPNKPKNTLATILAPDVTRLSEGRGDCIKRRKVPKSKEPRHNHNRSERGSAGKAEEDRGGVCHTSCQERQKCSLAVSNGGPGSSADEYLSVGVLSTPTTHAPWCRG